MPAFTPVYAIPYQTLADSPDGPNLGEGGFLVVDSALSGLDVRIDAIEAAVKFTKIAESILSGTAASVTFSSIPGTYRSLLLHVVARGDNATTFISNRLRFNSDSTAIYDSQQVLGNGATPLAGETINGTSIEIGEIAAASATAGACGISMVSIPFYTGTTFWKTLVSNHGLSTGTGTGTLHTKQWSGRWRNTAAISSITLLPSAGNFIAGSSFALYGLP